MNARPLAGRRVVTTRDERGRLDSLLARAGADVVHVPLITIAEAPDRGASLAAALKQLATFEWLVVTSRHGARRVGAAAAHVPRVRLAAVGGRTAAELTELSGRRPEVVPDQQTAASLADAMQPPADGARRLLLVQADRADGLLASRLSDRGFEVTAVVGYSTQLRIPTDAERSAVMSADAVAFASGSAALAWAEAFGSATPPVVVAIGPSTGDTAMAAGIGITHVASERSVEGLASAIALVFDRQP